MRESSALIVHSDKKTQRIVTRILGAAGYRTDIAEDLDQGLGALAHGDCEPPLLVVVDGVAAAGANADAFFAAAYARGAAACMTLVDGASYIHIPHILGLGAVTNLLTHAMPALAEQLTITAHKLVRKELFGADKYLLWGTDLAHTLVTRSSQRAGLVEELAATVKARGQSTRTGSMAMLIADELISNAVHNAPVDAAGQHYRKDIPRDTALELDERHQVDVRWGCDSRYFAIEVTDRFGSLDRDTILRGLGSRDVRESGGGAGMGLALAYRSCDHLIFDISPGNRTQVIALIDVRYHPSERVPASSYNVFVERTRE